MELSLFGRSVVFAGGRRRVPNKPDKRYRRLRLECLESRTLLSVWVATPAAANPSPASGATTNLSVLGADDAGEATLTYTWATTGTPPASVVFSSNGTNVSKNTVATFTKAGLYNFTVTIADHGGLSTTSSVSETVSQTLTSVVVTPGAVALALGAQQQFTATTEDQFGNAMSSQPTFTWAVGSGGGSISSSGLYTAPNNNDTPMITATGGGFTIAAWLSVGPATDALRVVPNWGASGVPSTLTMYEYVPTHLAPNPPIVVALCHYAGGAGSGFADAAGDGLVAAADQYGFILIAPQSGNPDGSLTCWDYGSKASLTHNGGGETQGIAQMVQYTLNTFHGDANRVYVTGGSAGAMMTQALLAVYPDVFKAGASFAGVPAGADGWGADQMSLTPQQWGDMVRACYPGYNGPRPRVQLWHSTIDNTVNPNNLIEGEREWSNVLGLSTDPTSTVSGITIKGQSYTEQIWQDSSGNILLEAWTEANGTHGTNAVDDATYLVPFFNLDKTPTTGVFSSAQETDVGSSSPAGSYSYVADTDTYTVSGGGAGIGGASDQFHSIAKSFTGDGSFIARVMTLQNTSTGAEAGVMLRDSTNANAMFAAMMVTAGQGAVFQWRSSTGGSSGSVQVTGITAPAWVKLVRSGNSFTAYYATTLDTPTDSDWVQVGTAQTISMSGTAQAGLAVTSQKSGTQCTGTFTRVQFGAMGIFNTSQDIGPYSAVGSSNYDAATGTYTLQGSGADMWGTSDQFRFLSQSFGSGGGSLVARVTGVENTDGWAKAGVMFRDSTDTGAMYAAMLVTPGNGVAFQWRSSTGGSTSQAMAYGITAPAWVKLVRSGNSYTAYYATTTGTPGTSDWIQVGSALTISMSNSAPLAGLAVTSHFDGILSVATFSGVQVNQTVSVVTAPTANPSPVNGTSTALSVLGAENGSDANLTYTWSATGYVAAPVTFSANGTNAAKNTVATFTAAGNYNFSVTITDKSGLNTVASVTVPVTMGIFNNSADIGSPSLAGSLSYNPSNGAYTVNAGGSNVGGTSDQFRYTYTTFNVNSQITARVTSVSNTNASAKAGVMFRDSTSANASYAFVWVSPSNQVTFETRSADGATASYSVGVAAGGSPVWVRLLRNGSNSNQFTAYYSLNGTSWTQVGTTQTVTMSSAYLAGLAVTSHNTTTLNTSMIDNVTVAGLNTRGWATLNTAHTTFVADNGQLLRAPFTSTEGNQATTEADIAEMKTLGFNAIHLYIEGADGNYPNPGSNTPGYEALAGDKIVQYCQDLGLYCIIVAGGSQQWVQDLWKFYAPRYANCSNVLYEISNEPDGSFALALMENGYSTIHTYAPNVPVLVFTPCNVYGTGGGQSALQNIQAFNQAEFGNPNAVWTNIAYSFHGYAPFSQTTAGVQTILNGGYPVFMTEANGTAWGTNTGGIDVQLTQWLELSKISWVVFVHTPAPFWICAGDVTDPNQYVNPVNESGLSWTPDFGTWPAVRGAYDTGSVPWNTTSTFNGNGQLTGTLHLEAENYDWGGQNVSYYDTTSGNQGGQYRPGDNVDITATNDIDGGFAISSTASGEWFEYTVNVPQAGYYNLGLRYSNATNGAAIDVASLRDGDLTGQLTLPTTGSLSTWNTLTTPIFLGGGQQILKFSIPAGGFDLNWFELTPAPVGAVSDGAYLIVNRASGMALQLDTSTNNIEQEPLASSSTVQQWNLQGLGASEYNVTSVNNGSYWTTYQRSTLGTGANWAATSIVLRPLGNGYYRILDTGGGLDFEIQNASTSAGALIDQNMFSGLASQEWAVVPLNGQIFPTGLNAYRDGTGNAQLNWTAASGAASYSVKRATTSGGPYTTIATGITGTGYVDTSAAANTTYYYVVSAVSSTGNESINSTEASVGPSATPRAWLKFDEGTGTTAADTTGDGWTGTLQGGATWSSGVSSGAVSLSGSNQYVSLSAGVVNGLTNFTISTWVNLTANSAWSRIFDFGTGTNVNMFLTANPSASNDLRFAITTGGSWSEQHIDANVTLSLNTWYQIAVTMSGGVGTLYVNGQAVATNSSMTLTPSSLGNTNQNYLGKSQYSDPYFNGKIDDFRIYASALSSSAIAGLYNAGFVPSVATAASATPSTVTGTTAQLAVLGADSGGESNLTYTWSLVGTPPASVTFSANGTNAAKNTTATFSRAGTYNFLVSITNANGGVVCSSVTVTVNQTVASVSVAPSSTAVSVNATKQFSATAYDQFGVALSAQPTFTWTVASGSGSVSSSGLCTAPATAGSATVQATSGSLSGTASVTVSTQAAPTVATAAAASPSPAGTSTTLSVRGASSAGEPTLTYTWSLVGTPPAPVTFSANGTNAAKSSVATFTAPGTYNFLVTITDQVGLTVTSSVSVSVNFGLFTNSADIGSPTLAGSLSYATSTVTYTVKAGGSDIWNTSDQFRYSYESYSGDGQITARVTSISNSDSWAKAGPMFRNGSAAGAAFADVVATPGNGVSFQWRGTDGGNPGYSQVGGINAPVWLRLVRSGNQFSGFYSTNGTTWTQIGSTQTVTMAISSLAGLAVTSHNASVLTTAVLDNVSISTIPTVAAAASATPLVVAGKYAQLTVLGADSNGEAGLTYTWSMTSGPASVTYSANGTNAAKTAMATFSKAGSYTFQATITNAGGLSTTSSVSVTVNLAFTSISVTPATASVGSGKTQQFTATAYDQFGVAMATQPTFTWTLASGVGSINSNGLYTASYAAGTATVTASSGSVTSLAATVTVTDAAPTVATIAKADNASPDTVAGKTTGLSVLAADVDGGGEPNLTYVWSVTGPTGVSFSSNNSNAAKNTTATFTQAGSYVFTATITDLGGKSTTSSVTVTVNQTPTSIAVSPTIASLGSDATQQFSATAYDQFGAALSTQPSFNWAVASGGAGSISSSGLYTASYASGTATVTATAASVTSPAASVAITDAAPTAATIAKADNASPDTVAGKTTDLSVLGADADGGGEMSLTYVWSVAGPTGVSFSSNNSNAAKSTTATFTQAGSYVFTATITDLGGQSTTSSVSVTVNQTLTSIAVSPASVSLGSDGTQQFLATAYDQFAAAMSTQPTVTWAVAAGVGSIDPSSGLYTASYASGTATVTASSGSVTSPAANVTVADAVPTVATPVAASPSTVTGTTYALSVLGADSDGGGEANLSYLWSYTGPASVTFGPNGSNTAKNAIATLSQAGSYTFTVTITDLGGQSTTSSVNVTISSQAQWNADATASWNTLGIWTDFGATVAAPGVRGMASDVALFTGAAGGTARLDGVNPTLAGITFNNAVTSYTIDSGSGGSLTLQGGAPAQRVDGATVSVLSGCHAISAPVHLANNTTVNAAASSTLTITGSIDGGAGLTMTGGGKLVLNAANKFSGGLIVQSGTVVLGAASALLDGSSLTVGGNFSASPAVAAPSISAVSPAVAALSPVAAQSPSASAAKLQRNTMNDMRRTAALTRVFARPFDSARRAGAAAKWWLQGGGREGAGPSIAGSDSDRYNRIHDLILSEYGQ